jgi:hypothetical protein
MNNITYFHSTSSNQIWQNKFQFPLALNGFGHAMVLRVTSSYKPIVKCHLPVPFAERSKAWVCDLSLAEIVGSNPGEDIDVCCLKMLRDGRSMCRADHLSREVLPSVVCPMSVIAKPRKGRPWPGIGWKSHKNKLKSINAGWYLQMTVLLNGNQIGMWRWWLYCLLLSSEKIKNKLSDFSRHSKKTPIEVFQFAVPSKHTTMEVVELFIFTVTCF